MNKIKIMEAAVAKWNRIIEGKGSDGGVVDCPPCRIYYMLVCFGCPIAKYTGKKFCKGTAYIPWYWHQINEHGKIRRRVYCEECRRLATDMRDFMMEIRDHLIAEEKKAQEDQYTRRGKTSGRKSAIAAGKGKGDAAEAKNVSRDELT